MQCCITIIILLLLYRDFSLLSHKLYSIVDVLVENLESINIVAEGQESGSAHAKAQVGQKTESLRYSFSMSLCMIIVQH